MFTTLFHLALLVFLPGISEGVPAQANLRAWEQLNAECGRALNLRRYEESEVTCRKAVEAAESLESKVPLSASLNNLVLALANLKRWSDAESVTKRLTELREKEMGDHSPLTAASYQLLAAIYRKTDRAAEADAPAKRAQEIQTKCEEGLSETVKSEVGTRPCQPPPLPVVLR